MNFSQALSAILDGRKVRRTGWRSGDYLTLSSNHSYTVPVIDRVGDGFRAPWGVVTTADQVAEDFILCDGSEGSYVAANSFANAAMAMRFDAGAKFRAAGWPGTMFVHATVGGDLRLRLPNGTDVPYSPAPQELYAEWIVGSGN